MPDSAACGPIDFVLLEFPTMEHARAWYHSPEYTEARAQEEGAPSPRSNGNLRFANQALTAEMCIAFGTTSLGSLGLPAVARTPHEPPHLRTRGRTRSTSATG